MWKSPQYNIISTVFQMLLLEYQSNKQKVTHTESFRSIFILYFRHANISKTY
jgi:hypothetical protein